MSKHIYDPAFPHLGGNIEGGDPYTFYPELWKWFVDELKVRDVLDVGCGEGHALDEFKKLGCRVIGVDGLKANLKKCFERHLVMHVDLTERPYLLPDPHPKNLFAIRQFDLVWCCEVVEHIEEKYIDNLMATLCQGKYVAITHALPKQRGVHHVNCQTPEYWIDQFVKRGYRLDLGLTALSMRYVSNPDHHWRRSGLIFVAV